MANVSVPHVVVDGSNIATEGRSTPSLRQLDEAVRAFMEQHPSDKLTVVVDATFGHRIDDSEKQMYEEAVAAGELITPPAGAIGRGDAFVLEIADRSGATILSNDSFQEFHGQFEWLFDEGRLIGGKPVPHVGWIFLMRTPVRGPTSRRAVRDAKTGGTAKGGRARTSKKSARKAAASTAPAPTTPKAPAKPKPKADVAAKAENGLANKRGGRGRRRGREKAFEPYNDPLPFIEFVGAHPVGSEVAGDVERFSSHGAYVLADGARCYVPLKAMGEPPPRSAKEVLNVGETRVFVVQSIDTPRRGIDLALPGFVEAVPEVAVEEPAPAADEIPVAQQPTEEERVTPAKKAATRKAATKKAAAKKTTARKAAAKKATAKKAPARKTAAKKTTVKKAATKKAAAKKATAKKTAAKKAPARKTAAKKATAKKAPARKAAAKKTSAKKATAKKTAAKKAPARRATKR